MSAVAGEITMPTPTGSSAPSPDFTMKRLINHLVQLQELLEARAQQAAIGADGRLEELETSITALLRELDPAIAGTFVKLHQRNHTAIVPVIRGACSGCGMVLPISQAHAVRAATELHQLSELQSVPVRRRPVDGNTAAGRVVGSRAEGRHRAFFFAAADAAEPGRGRSRWRAH
jgi:Fe-S cluster biogenesis protein NfuA